MLKTVGASSRGRALASKPKLLAAPLARLPGVLVPPGLLAVGMPGITGMGGTTGGNSGEVLGRAGPGVVGVEVEGDVAGVPKEEAAGGVAEVPEPRPKGVEPAPELVLVPDPKPP